MGHCGDLPAYPRFQRSKLSSLTHFTGGAAEVKCEDNVLWGKEHLVQESDG